MRKLAQSEKVKLRKMKTRFLYIIAIGTILGSCGAPEIDQNLVDLQTKRD